MFIFLKPRELLAGIAAGVALDALYSLFQRPAPVEIVEQFLVTYCVQGIHAAHGIHAAGFFKQAVCHHLVHTGIDTIVKLFTLAIESDLDNLKRPLRCLFPPERSVGLACHHADFEGMNHAAGVLAVNDFVVFWIESFQLLNECFDFISFMNNETNQSKIPLEIVEKGILYYARDDESRLHMLQSLRLCYEKAHPAQRWTFKDPDHYFIKFYGRSLPGANPSNGERSHAYAILRVMELFEDHDDFVRAYSVLDGKRHLLLRLMESYYHIGEVRNAVNHAEEKAPVISLENINVRSENKDLLLMQKAIENFIRAYEEVLKAVDQVPEAPVIRISGEEFRTWYAGQLRGGKRKRRGAGSRNTEQSGNADGSEERTEASARNL